MTDIATVHRDISGSWSVKQGETIIQKGCTNAYAWKVADRLNREPVSRQEDISDWVVSKTLNATPDDGETA